MQYNATVGNMYSRELIAGDREVLPYSLNGFRRSIFFVVYVCVILISFGCIGYSLYVDPLIGLFGMLAGYLGNNIAFSITHVRFHTSFIELPESRMELLVHHSFIHHYRDVQVYHKTWLETRMSYFIDPKAGLLSPVFLSMFPGTLLISYCLYLYQPVLGLTYFSTAWAAELLQSTIHEWYHNPVSNRKSFYNPVLFWLFTFLEKIGIASTRDHLQHHRHRLHNLNQVEKWMDLYLPFGEWLPTLIWKRALARYVPGEARMTAFVQAIIYTSFVVLHALLILSYLGMYRLVHGAGA